MIDSTKTFIKYMTISFVTAFLATLLISNVFAKTKDPGFTMDLNCRVNRDVSEIHLNFGKSIANHNGSNYGLVVMDGHAIYGFAGPTTRYFLSVIDMGDLAVTVVVFKSENDFDNNREPIAIMEGQCHPR